MVFVMSTVVMHQVPDTVQVSVFCVIAGLLGLATLGARAALSSVRTRPRDALFAAAGGVAGFWLAPLITLSQRASDAPSGAVVLFLTTALWGVIACVTAWGFAPKTTSALALAAAVASAVGSAAVLANWERPSSFSPFIKYPQQELVIVLAGVAFAVGALALVRASRELDRRAVTLIAIVSAAVVSVVAAVPQLPSVAGDLSRLSSEFVLLGLGAYALAWGWSHVVTTRGVVSASPALLAAPALLTLLSVLERMTGVYGPNPIQWGGAVPGVVLCIAGATVVYLAAPQVRSDGWRSGALLISRICAGLACAAAAVGLFLPALRAASVGTLPEPFEAIWAMYGFESAAAWLPVAGSLVLLAASMLAPHRLGRTAAVLASVTTFVAAWAYRPLLDTPLHTWNNWIPSDVQQTYGTEYARFSVEIITSPASIAAVVLSVVGALALVIAALKVVTVEDET